MTPPVGALGESGQPETIRVLLVEDDRDDYTITRQLLATNGARRFDLVWRTTLADGIRALGDSVQAVLLDLSLPDSQGWDTFLRVRQAAPQLPVILLTGLEDEAMGMRAVHEGAQDYLVKNHLESHLLTRAIVYAIERKRIEDRLASVVEELSRRNAQMVEDAALAREVQLSLMPRQFPAFPAGAVPAESRLAFSSFYRPSETVAGDFFSVFPVSPTEAGVFICDVMGHGMRSALVTAILRGLLEELKPQAADPAHLLSEIGRALGSVLHVANQLIFASACYLVIDSSTGLLRLANAGHPHPLRLRGRGRTAEWMVAPLPSFGAALGILPDVAYGNATWQLEPGDRLLLYTDGLFEATNSAGEEYGQERLMDAALRNGGLALEAVLPAVLAEVEQFAGGHPFHDDICALALGFGPPAGAPDSHAGENRQP